ncbi:hypothetical protein N779_13585 [Vibrio coralliilyticus OCN008]|nr:hypothetical protein N779_13585 [Vibrio coralliilyticus OCN008]
MSLNIIEQFYQQYFNATLSEQASVVQQSLNPDVKWCVAHPVNDLNGPEATHTSFLSPLVTAMPDVERRPMIVMNGEFEGRTWYNSTGYFVGTFEQPLFGIPATGKTLYLRYTEMVCVENNQITESYMIPDFIDTMNQSRVNPLRKSLGHDGLIPSPATADGIQNSDVCEEHSAKSGQLVHDMLACLGRFDGKDLYSMDLENYWHKDFMWYGPAGIGTTRGIKGFRNHHQAPFVFAFPDRSVDIELNFWPKMTTYPLEAGLTCMVLIRVTAAG